MTDDRIDSPTRAWERLPAGPAPVAEMLRAHRVVRRRRRLGVVATVTTVVLLAVTAGCLARPADPGRTGPGPAGPVATGSPTVPAPAPAPGPASGPSTVFFVLAGSGLPYLGVLPMKVRTRGPDPGLRAVAALLTSEPPRQVGFAGTTNPWLADGRPLARVASVREDAGLATVDLAALDAAARAEPSWPSEIPLQQLVCTAREALGSRSPVRVTLRGEPVPRLFGVDARRAVDCPAIP